MTGKNNSEQGDGTKICKEMSPSTHFQCPMLNATNYTTWAIRMQIILEANSLWEAIVPQATTKDDEKRDKTAIAYLYQSLPEDQLLLISKYKTAKAVWDALKVRHVGVTSVQKARLQTLKTEFEMLHMKENESIDSFTTKLTGIINKAASLGQTYEDSTLVRKLLNAVPDRFLQIVTSIEQYSDLDTMSLDEAIGRLKTFEERLKYKKERVVDTQEGLMFTRHEHRGQPYRGRGRGRFNQSRGRGHSRYTPGRKNWEPSQNSSRRETINNNTKKFTHDKSKVQCFKCKKYGHFASKCSEKDQEPEHSNLIEEDLEPTLLMATIEDHQKVFLNERNLEVNKMTTNDESLWYLDNGASNHMTGVKDHFNEIDEKITGNVRFGDGSYIKGKGSILLECKNEEQRVISQVYYIPNLKSNILSLGQLTENGCKVVMEDDLLLLYDSSNDILLKVTRSKNRLYKASLRIGKPVCLFANLHDKAWLWHARLGHLNFGSMKNMVSKKLVHGIPPTKHTTNICDICLIGKHGRAPFSQQANMRSETPLDLVFGDLCGPISPPTPTGKRYIFLLIDDYSRYMWEYFLDSKDQAFEIFKEFKQMVENKLGIKLKMFRTDRGEEFTSNEFLQYCKDNGISRQLTAPYSPQQNGVVERKNRTILSATRCRMKATNLPQIFWAEAVRHAILILNCTPTKSLEDITPYEALKGRKPNLHHLRIFGCIAYAKVPSQHLTKLDDRSIRMVYLGSEPGSKAYRLFDPLKNRICVSRDVKFKEDETWNWEEYTKDYNLDRPEWTDFIIGNNETPGTQNILNESEDFEDNVQLQEARAKLMSDGSDVAAQSDNGSQFSKCRNWIRKGYETELQTGTSTWGEHTILVKESIMVSKKQKGKKTVNTDEMDVEHLREIISAEVTQVMQNTLPGLFEQMKDELAKTVNSQVEAAMASRPSGSGSSQNSKVTSYKDFTACQPPFFQGQKDPVASTRWITEIEGAFLTSSCAAEVKMRYASNLLRGPAKDWWNILLQTKGPEQIEAMTWEQFKELFKEQYVPQVEVERLTGEFLGMEQTTESVNEITDKFLEKSLFCRDYVANEPMKMYRYAQILKPEIR
ncbi:LOW QUALITY PROTEIN: hypothetical protein OSB04_028716 [Centaurea solstitialis]|uniref:Zinc finger, CCHC-type n=1 Tax=Centaurea solstitialis TaxID=347529 RepID=A0AA38W803_9ASTR|nr:LOW QUALITY PROTEIN: hypothetical protein OSB04_028716 [Centaurea solstitialis]